MLALITRQFGIRKTRSSAYHPQTNDRAEVAVKAVKQQLRSHCEETAAPWDAAVPFCELALRSGVNTSTGVSPAALFLGRRIRHATDMVLEGDTLPEA